MQAINEGYNSLADLMRGAFDRHGEAENAPPFEIKVLFKRERVLAVTPRE